MTFLFNFFKKGGAKAAVNNSTVTSPIENSKYANWTKEQLIRKLIERDSLEGNTNKEKQKQSYVGKKRKSANSDIGVESKKPKAAKKFDFSKYDTRFIALKFAYLGWNYNGLAIQKEPTPLPTVEGVILEAMNKCRLVPSMNPQDYKFSRCGRTDKGVSAMSQVISLKVRSNLTPEEQANSDNDSKEIQYVDILNQLLPDDIRVSAVCLRPPKDFDARFSCKHRHYKYLFNKEGLDLEKMEQAAKYYEGENDFRNFCKLDGSKQITNYKRTIISASIMHVSGDFYCFDLIGSAFLWHQVRCMMANLFLVGQGLEDHTLIKDMLDIEKTPRKPIYDMASDVPLILYDCKFEDMEWKEENLNDYKAIKYGKSVNTLMMGYQLKATVATIFKNTLPTTDVDFQKRTRINLGDGKGKVVTNYVKMDKRQVMESYEIVNKKFKQKKNQKKSL
ncbi:hypothetical protein Kpol_1058p44 [Vanderwaltozyma polyspora DSM 70294]|uniref:Pseudouridine synthase I TruA alpha/beta domain-containing protein n=1 Tax=Vanderwaltozyma polyspora (strain ATCC 22028 / DSM 70294 / BCRC 21397 / CBS 2163 / NBRC 10782 / NRRL Y-8283 / UCD 57-17) TaxID=436907 RepID=A7TJS8_VANPO|nr:uncharacterized protein Kpol_1058p44 [Vanderwaltozyma polyspora DSM 70294]EDO17507.1 hypothetical protein Kpol_1058p44 [Vanderwaltozyma polyspora DSM 70294]